MIRHSASPGRKSRVLATALGLRKTSRNTSEGTRWGQCHGLPWSFCFSTAARRGDVVKLGPQHVHDGTITFEQSKTKGGEEAYVVIPLHPDFCAALKAMPPSNVVRLTPATTFLTTSFGQPFKTAASLGNWFRDRRKEAGLPNGISAHGLRKAAARRLAEIGCTAHQIAAVTGHATLAEVQRYTKAADRSASRRRR